MSRNLKALGIALAGMFVLSAVAAQGAFAEEFFHAHSKHVVIKGEAHPQAPTQKTIINNNAGEKKGEVQCKKLEITGDVEGVGPTEGTWTSTLATVRPKYSECEVVSPFKAAATVNTGKCHYRFTSNTVETAGTGLKHGPVKVTCPKGENIKIETPSTGCVITVTNPENPVGSGEFGQTPKDGVVYTNVNTGGVTKTKELTVHATAKGIEFTSNFTCQLAGIPASGEKAEYEGTSTVKAFEYRSGDTELGYPELGEQVGIEKF
jgi:hypothetical protein